MQNSGAEPPRASFARRKRENFGFLDRGTWQVATRVEPSSVLAGYLSSTQIDPVEIPGSKHGTCLLGCFRKFRKSQSREDVLVKAARRRSLSARSSINCRFNLHLPRMEPRANFFGKKASSFFFVFFFFFSFRSLDANRLVSNFLVAEEEWNSDGKGRQSNDIGESVFSLVSLARLFRVGTPVGVARYTETRVG